jgi:hypothetical protein
MLWYSDAGSDGRRVMFRFARHWPKVVIAIGVLLTVAWMVFLAWLMVHALLTGT